LGNKWITNWRRILNFKKNWLCTGW